MAVGHQAPRDVMHMARRASRCGGRALLYTPPSSQTRQGIIRNTSLQRPALTLTRITRGNHVGMVVAQHIQQRKVRLANLPAQTQHKREQKMSSSSAARAATAVAAARAAVASAQRWLRVACTCPICGGLPVGQYVRQRD